MTKPKWNVGDKVWRPKFDRVENTITCRDCNGKGFLTVILGDDSKVTIQCMGCNLGSYYEGFASGVQRFWERKPYVEEVTISGVEVQNNVDIKYRFQGGGYADEADLSQDKSEAVFISDRLAQEHNEREEKRARTKEKDHKSWAWHVSYYTKKLRDHQQEIERIQKKLDVANHLKNRRR